MPTYVPNDSPEQVCFLAAAFIETGFYGIYVALFVLNCVYTVRRRGVKNDTRLVSKPFFWALAAMFILATFHEFLTIFRIVRAYALGLGRNGTPLSYLRQNTRWDNQIHLILIGVMICLGDALVIYRCWIVWNYNLWVIALPSFIFVVTVGINITLDIWFATVFTKYQYISRLVDFGYPTNLAQNVLTTSLIAWKILRQHQLSASGGVVSSDGMSLITVMRVVVESALIYTTELVILITLYFVNNPAQFIVQAALVPSVGIVFVLIALRVNIARDRSVTSRGFRSSMLPTWRSQAEDIEEIDSQCPPTSQMGHRRVVSISGNEFALEVIGPRKSVNIVNYEGRDEEDLHVVDKPLSMSI